MGIGPKIPSQRLNNVSTKVCSHCGESHKIDDFAETRSYFYPDGRIPICIKCVNSYLEEYDWNWKYVDKICQYADIPFIPKEWIRMQEQAGEEAFLRYASIFLAEEFEEFGWDDYFEEFKLLRDEGKIKDQLPIIAENKRKELVKKWNNNYSNEEFEKLEDLLDGMYLTQNITTTLQIDQALKLCKLSLEIDSRIREGADVDKLLSSYEKLIKIADFTPKNSKSASDLESTGELCKWLEAGGWKNRFYDGATRDQVDETIKNIQNWNQRLYINETGIGEEITRRIEALKYANDQENNYELNTSYDADQYEADGYERLMDEDNEVFVVDMEE